jgi:hypothetical protein
MSRYNCNVVESVCNLWQVGSFLLVLWFPQPIKMSRYNCNVVESVCNLRQVRGNQSTRRKLPTCHRLQTLSTTLQLYRDIFIGRGNQSTRRKLPTCHRLQTLSTTLQLYHDIFIGWGNQSTRRKLPTWCYGITVMLLKVFVTCDRLVVFSLYSGSLYL